MGKLRERSKVLLAVVAAVLCALIVGVAPAVSATDHRAYVEVVIKGHDANDPNATSYAWRGFMQHPPRIGELFKWQLGKFRFAKRFSERVVDVQHGGTSPQLLIILKSAEGCCEDWFSRWGDRTQ